MLWSSSSLLHYNHCHHHHHHHHHHQAIRMLSQNRNNKKLNGIGFIIIIRLLECSVNTEGNKNWMELNLPSASHHHHQPVRMLNQHRNKQDHCLCVYMSHGFGGLGVARWPLVPKFAGSNPAEAVGFFRAKKSSARLPSEGK